MHNLVRPTEMIRATVVQEARVVLEPCLDPNVKVRRVQVLVPASPPLLGGLDTTPDNIGPNRTYKIMVLPPGAAIVFHLRNEQFLVLAAQEAKAHPTLIVEYMG